MGVHGRPWRPNWTGLKGAIQVAETKWSYIARMARQHRAAIGAELTLFVRILLNFLEQERVRNREALLEGAERSLSEQKRVAVALGRGAPVVMDAPGDAAMGDWTFNERRLNSGMLDDLFAVSGRLGIDLLRRGGKRDKRIVVMGALPRR
jgi:hypothetical protein